MKIHELAANLTNQIAAGEVVERPASVVKELVENAIDAQATQIDIVVEDSGLKAIQVIDNGIGIDPEDVPLAFKRHATSKIDSREDLFKVQTLGFRGEALPSIASIADVVMETATSQSAGTKIHIKGGKLVKKEIAASRPGTEVTVSDLFFNTPARLKYLRSLPTELAAISDIVYRLALGHTDIAFSLSNNGRQMLQTAGNGNLQQTLGAIYSVSAARQMVEISGENLDFKVQGYISLPKLTRASRKYITLLINGRYVKNFQLTKAIIAGYGSKLMVARYPIAAINIELNPLLVDVNVHPTKQEVRISKEESLCKLISDTIYQRLAKENLIPDALTNMNSGHSRRQVDFSQLEMGMNEASAAYKSRNSEPETSVREKRNEQEGEPEKESPQTSDFPVISIKSKADLQTPMMKEWDHKYSESAVQPADENNFVSVEENKADASDEALEEKRFPNLTYIGQMHGTFLLAESPDGLYIVDQHAAQERTKYEYYREKIGEVSPDMQKLLIPIVLTYPTSDILQINQNLDKLAQLGIKLEDFGPNSYVVREHPTWFVAGQEESTIKEMIDYFLKDHKLSIAKFREKTAIMMSCKRSIKANHHLDDRQAKALLVKLSKCENPFNCPHGRPTLVHFTNKDIEHMFKRIQDPHKTDLLDEEL